MSRVLLLSALILMACGRMPRSSSAADSPKDESGSSEASTSKESSDSSKPEDSSTSKAPSGPSCLNAQGEVQECMSDKDCCTNFYCGIDPDGSTRIKTCLYGGK